MLTDSTTIDIVKGTVSFVAAILFFIAFLIPLIKTYIPLWKTRKRLPSHTLTFRVLVRLALALLLLHEALFPIERLAHPPYGPEILLLRIIVIPLIIFLAFMLIGTWMSHPDGLKGL